MSRNVFNKDAFNKLPVTATRVTSLVKALFLDHSRLPPVNCVTTNTLVALNNRFSDELDGRPARKSGLYRAGSRRIRNDYPNLWDDLCNEQVLENGMIRNLNQSEFKDLLYMHILDNDDNVHYPDNGAPTYYRRNMTKSEFHKYYRKVNAGKKSRAEIKFAIDNPAAYLRKETTNVDKKIMSFFFRRLEMPTCHLPRITYQDAWLYGTRGENVQYYNNWRNILEDLGYPLRNAERAAFIREIEEEGNIELPDPAGIDRNEIAAFEELIPRPPPATIIDPTIDPPPQPADFPNARMIILDRENRVVEIVENQPRPHPNREACANVDAPLPVGQIDNIGEQREPNAQNADPSNAPIGQPDEQQHADPNADLMQNLHRDADALAQQFLNPVDVGGNKDDEYDHDAPHDEDNESSDDNEPADPPNEDNLPAAQNVENFNVPQRGKKRKALYTHVKKDHLTFAKVKVHEIYVVNYRNVNKGTVIVLDKLANKSRVKVLIALDPHRSVEEEIPYTALRKYNPNKHAQALLKINNEEERRKAAMNHAATLVAYNDLRNNRE
uniref:Uncharacterized protein n=1 Tax=Trichogramma kaykai TaxID=54128 RepID=A0ABD2W4W8_9HYME